MEFYKCKHCGNIIAYVKNTGVKVVCCKEPMERVIANSVDASQEKHVPIVEINGNDVRVLVSTIEHPMAEEHFIEWVAIETKFGNQRKILTPNSKPEVSFSLVGDDEIKNVYAYCNIHGLWRN